MPSRRPLTALVAAVLVSASLASAAAAPAASTGGAAPGVLILPGPPETVVRIGDPIARASAGGVTISVRTTAVVRGRARVSGSVARRRGTPIRIEQLDPAHGWLPVAKATVRADGSFVAVWRPRHSGVIQLRALVADGNAASGTAGAAANAPRVAIAVYRRGVASWYGPSGSGATTTACGVPLDATTLGVAHRTLPCGTPVALTYRGRMLVVPVIDRGPFAPGRTWDLTAATFQALGGGAAGLIRLGALPLTNGAGAAQLP